MYCIGLTGTTGSGKSTVASNFATLGINVISADEIAKQLTLKNEPAFQDILHHFGNAVLTPAGELNRPYLRQLIFKNKQERVWLEQLLHPLIRKQIEYNISNVTTPYCIIEIPLLTDGSNYPYLHRILLIKAERQQQIERFMARDNSSKEEALAVLLAQKANEAKHLDLADDILSNTGSRLELKEKVDALHTKYLRLAR